MRKYRKILFLIVSILGILFITETTSYAITITPTDPTISKSDAANILANALTAGTSGLVITNASLSDPMFGLSSSTSGIFINPSGTYGIGPGIVLSTGVVSDYNDGPDFSSAQTTVYGVPATATQETLLDPLTGGGFDHFDTTELNITFDMLPGFDTIFFNMVFGSEEFPEFVGFGFADGLGIYLNGANIAEAGGLPVNIDHPDMAALPGLTTELDGVLAPGGNPLLTFSKFVGNGSTGNELTFIIADTGDTSFDTTAYLSGFGGTPIPEPTSLSLLGLGLLSILKFRQKQVV